MLWPAISSSTHFTLATRTGRAPLLLIYKFSICWEIVTSTCHWPNYFLFMNAKKCLRSIWRQPLWHTLSTLRWTGLSGRAGQPCRLCSTDSMRGMRGMRGIVTSASLLVTRAVLLVTSNKKLLVAFAARQPSHRGTAVRPCLPRALQFLGEDQLCRLRRCLPGYSSHRWCCQVWKSLNKF